MAIQALSVFAGLYSNRPGDLTVNVMHSADASFNANMSVTMENAIVLQSVEVGYVHDIAVMSGSSHIIKLGTVNPFGGRELVLWDP